LEDDRQHGTGHIRSRSILAKLRGGKAEYHDRWHKNGDGMDRRDGTVGLRHVTRRDAPLIESSTVAEAKTKSGCRTGSCGNPHETFSKKNIFVRLEGENGRSQ